MIESPLIQEIVAEQVRQVVAEQVQQAVAETDRTRAQEDILAFLESRFGEVPPDLAEQIRSVADERRLRDLVRRAGASPDLETFRKEIERQSQTAEN